METETATEDTHLLKNRSNKFPVTLNPGIQVFPGWNERLDRVYYNKTGIESEEVCVMRNYAVKYAILLRRFDPDCSPQRFLELSEAQAFERFRGDLPDPVRHAVFFAFSDRAFLEVIDRELEVDTTRYSLEFRKPFLDARSIHLAGLPGESLQRRFSDHESRMIDMLADYLMETTRHLYRTTLNEHRQGDILEEYREMLRIYATKRQHHPDNPLARMFSSPKALTKFLYAMVVDAMLKAEAVRLLLGEDSAYHRVWQRKMMFRRLMAAAVETGVCRQAA